MGGLLGRRGCKSRSVRGLCGVLLLLKVIIESRDVVCHLRALLGGLRLAAAAPSSSARVNRHMLLLRSQACS